MMRNLLRFDVTAGNSNGATVVALNMDEISTISDTPNGDTRVVMTNGEVWNIVGTPTGTMDLIANITDEAEGRSL